MTYRHLLILVHTHRYTYTQVYVCTHTLKLYCLLDVKEIYHRKYVLGVHPLWPRVLPISLAGCVLKLSQLMGTDPGAPVITSPNPGDSDRQNSTSQNIQLFKVRPRETSPGGKKNLHFRSKHFEEEKKKGGGAPKSERD